MMSIAEALAPPVDILDVARDRYSQAVARWLDEEERRWSYLRRDREFIALLNAGTDLQAAIDLARELAADTFPNWTNGDD